MPDNECNCDITPGYDSTLENRLIKGQELIYYTSKIKQAIASAVASSEAESASSLQELLELLGDLETALESHDNNLNQHAEEIQGTLSDLEDLITSKKTELTRDIMANENNVLAGISSARQVILDALSGFDLDHDFELLSSQLAESTQSIENKIDAASDNSLTSIQDLIGSAKQDVIAAIDGISEQELQPALDAISSTQDHLDDSIIAARNQIGSYFEQGYQDAVEDITGSVDSAAADLNSHLDSALANIDYQLSDIADSISNIDVDIPTPDYSSITEAIGTAKADVIDAIGNIDIDPSAINQHTTAEADRILEGIEDVVIAGGDQLNQHMDSVEDAVIAEIQRQATDPETGDTLLSKIKALLTTPKNMCLDCSNMTEYIINSANAEHYQIMPVASVSEEKFNELIQGLYSYNICNLTVYVTGDRIRSNGPMIVTCHPIVGAYSYTTRSIEPVDDAVMETIPDEIKYTYDSLPYNMDGILMMFTQSLTPYDETIFITSRRK